ncbi:N-acetylmuramoyl-L-alanine amidase [Halobacillus salinus]|nr:N-acetylmuramoyl-L-alanine amidase [Halobacillus salinus]
MGIRLRSLVILLGIILMSSSSSVYADEVVVEVDDLNVRSGAGLHFDQIMQVEKGQEFSILKEQDEWVQIEADGQKGWIAKWLTKEKESLDTNTVIVNTSTLNVRSYADTDSEIVGSFHRDDTVKYITQKDDWYQVQTTSGQEGWIAGWLVKEVEGESHTTESDVVKRASPDGITAERIQLLYNHTNLRSSPSTKSRVVGTENEGETLQVVEKQGDWFKVKYKGSYAFVADWIVLEKESNSDQADGNLNGKNILIDAGHGGRDSGAIGVSGAFEKDYTLKTALALKEVLESNGANVQMTRKSNIYLPLFLRSYFSNSSSADVFLSLHYNSTPQNTAARGINTYYFHERDQNLATYVQRNMIEATNFQDRGIKHGNFHVIRENHKPSLLLELGFLSDLDEEHIIEQEEYHSRVSQGIAEGLIAYFQN